jgi:hypothetical protein
MLSVVPLSSESNVYELHTTLTFQAS